MIEIQGLTKKYGDIDILDDTSFQFPNKGLVCILGESGCGKTTLINLIAGLDNDYKGQITVDQVELMSMTHEELCRYRKDYIGFIFQDYYLFSNYTSLENVMFPCMLNKQDNSLLNAKRLLNDLGLKNKEDEKIQNLSGGQKQRVAIARALMNNPKIILADEPTGALDRKTSNEIMQILKEISETRLVILITHDQHILEYADEVIYIHNKKICVKNRLLERKTSDKMSLNPINKVNCFKIGLKNFMKSFYKYFFTSIIFSLGVLCLILSLSSGNIMETSVQSFKEKNVVFNNGYIKNTNQKDIYNHLINDNRIENVYKQYILKDITLNTNKSTEKIAFKYPLSRTTETLSYGVMPRRGKQEIALTPSLGKKFNKDIKELIGSQITLNDKNEKHVLTVSGIYNAGYDDFFISSDIEQQLYQGLENDKYYSISFDVKDFNDVVGVYEKLVSEDIQSEMDVDEVKIMTQTFQRIQTLFMTISIMILFISLFIVVVILIKLQRVRYKMVGVLSVIGFNKKVLSKIVLIENCMFTFSILITTTILLKIAEIVGGLYSFNINISASEFVLTLILTAFVIQVISFVLSYKMMNTIPIEAMKK